MGDGKEAPPFEEADHQSSTVSLFTVVAAWAFALIVINIVACRWLGPACRRTGTWRSASWPPPTSVRQAPSCSDLTATGGSPASSRSGSASAPPGLPRSPF